MGSKDLLTKIFEDVREDIDSGSYINLNGEEVRFKKNNSMMHGTERINNPGRIDPSSRVFEDFPDSKFYVENIDFLKKAIELRSPETAILNPASGTRAGGGVRSGARALEEIICRRSNLIKSLEKFAQEDGKYDPSLEQTEVIWSPNVNIYRDEHYAPLDFPVMTNVISAAAINHPKLTSTGQYERGVDKVMKKKIRAVLRVAIMKGMVCLVLPAWGCGAFCNPASEVARCFYEVLHETEFYGAFEEVCFAIIDDHNAHRTSNPDGNYIPFFETFNK